MKVAFVKSEEVAANIRRFHFTRLAHFNYTAGQFIHATLPHEGADDRGVKRFFTLTSSPTESELMITTKFYERPSSFKQALRGLKEGDEIEITEVSGDFILPEKPGRQLVLVAGGIGVTPYRSMIKYLTDTGNNPHQLHLLYAANRPDEIAFRDLFDAGLANLKVTYLVREADGGWDGAIGVLNAKKIDELAAGIMNKVVYLSGPEPMVESLVNQLKAAGQPDSQVKTDYFPNYPDY